MTQTDLGSVLNTTQQTVNNYENGKRKPDQEMFEKIADFFGVSTDYLLGRTHNPTPFTTIKEDSPGYGSENQSPSKTQAQLEELLKKLPEDLGVKFEYIKVIEKYEKMGLSPEQLDEILGSLLKATEFVKSKIVDK